MTGSSLESVVPGRTSHGPIGIAGILALLSWSVLALPEVGGSTIGH